MHIESAMLSVAVGAAGMAASGTGSVLSARRLRKDPGPGIIDRTKWQNVALAGGFVFVAQMFNFGIPMTGSSGHLVGGILLACLLGPYTAYLMMGAIVLTQAFLFNDGGILAAGVNFVNMGLIPCMLVYPLVHRKLAPAGSSGKRIWTVSVLSCAAGLVAGAGMVCVEAALSGSSLQFGAFLTRMLPIHLVVGLVEGVITGTVLVGVTKVAPEHTLSARNKAATSSPKMVFGGVALLLLTTAAYFFGSGNPDGLNWSILGAGGNASVQQVSSLHIFIEKAEQFFALLPGYQLSGQEGSMTGHLLSALAGVALLSMITVLVFTLYKKRLARQKAKVRIPQKGETR